MYNVFVYGTLKKGFHNHPLIERGEYMGDAYTCEEYSMLICTMTGIPFVVKEENYPIVGEVYSVDKKTFNDLDRLEGHPTFYRRELIDIFIPDGIERIVEMKAWIYFLRGGYDVNTMFLNTDGEYKFL
mgnify:FL=1|tara:strand:- start:21 stop:404 length:384 start_codon:yes stop_codon:yes gene_type:complete